VLTTKFASIGIADSRNTTEALVRDCARQLGNWDEETFEGVWRRIGELGAYRALPMVVRVLADPDPGVRAGAAEIVGEIGGREELAALLPLLDDELASVRQSAALAYARLAADPTTTLQALELIDRGGADRAAAVPHKVVEAKAYRIGFYIFPMPERSPRIQEIGSRLLYAARVVDGIAGSFVGLIEVRRDASRHLQRTRLDIFDGHATTRLKDFSTTPAPNEIGAAIAELLAQRCPTCHLFSGAGTDLCRGCGAGLAGDEGPAGEAASPVLDLTISSTDGPVALAEQLARDPETARQALDALRGEIERGAPIEALEPLWKAFAAAGADSRAAERERLALALAEAGTARGAASLEEMLDRQRASTITDSGVAFRALAQLFPRSLWRPGDSLLVGARLAPFGDAFAVGTRSGFSVYDSAMFALTASRAFFGDPPGQVGAARSGWRERPAGFTEGWLARFAYAPRGGLVAETVRFVPGSVERLEPSLVMTLHVDPLAERGITIQAARSIHDATGKPWAIRWDQRGLALLDGSGIRVHDFDTGSVVAFAAPHAGHVQYLGYSPDGSRLATSDGHEARLWSAERGVMLRSLDLKEAEMLGFDRLGRLLTLRRDERRTVVIDLMTGAHVGESGIDDLLHITPDGVLRCSPAGIHRRYSGAEQRLAGLGPSGRALFASETDVLYWDGSQERALHFGRYEPGT
jgi:HEAT repeat protein